MKKAIIIVVLFTQAIFCQSPMAELITVIKKSVVPIICVDNQDNTVQGTGVTVLNSHKVMLVLTCAHVVVTHDSTNKQKFFDKIYIASNKKDSIENSSFLPLVPLYADTLDDFAILFISDEGMDSSFVNNLQIVGAQSSLWKTTDDIFEGESIIYMGYPLSKGIEKRNYPITRIGIISQLVKGRNSFLIDGFVQHGSSGSPVFLFSERSTGEYVFSLIGIATSFPSEFTNIYKKLDQSIDPNLEALINPGFTNVTSMNKIIPILNKIDYAK